MATLASRLGRVAGPLTVLRILGQGGEFLAFVVLARRLGTTGFGEVSVAFLICRYGGLIADWGASLKGTRDVAAGRHPDALHALVRRRYLVTAVLTLGFVAGTWLTGHAVLAPLGLTIVGRGIGRDWLALGEERGMRAGVPSVLQGLGAFVLCLGVTTVPAASWALGLAYAGAAIASVRLNPLPRRSAVVATSHTGVDGWFLTFLLSDQVYATADVLLISLLISAAEAGTYAAVYRLPNALITVLGLVVVGSLPGLTQVVRSGTHRYESLRRRALGAGAIAAGFVVASIPVAWVLVPVIFGDAYEAGQGPLVLLLLATAFPALTVGVQPLYLAGRSERPLALFAAGVAVINVLANLLVIPRHGLMGAAAVTLASQAVIAGFYLVAGRHPPG